MEIDQEYKDVHVIATLTKEDAGFSFSEFTVFGDALMESIEITSLLPKAAIDEIKEYCMSIYEDEVA